MFDDDRFYEVRVMLHPCVLTQPRPKAVIHAGGGYRGGRFWCLKLQQRIGRSLDALFE